MDEQFFSTSYKDGRVEKKTYSSIVQEDIYHETRSAFNRFMNHPNTVNLHCKLSDKSCSITKPMHFWERYTFLYSDNEGKKENIKLTNNLVERYMEKFILDHITGPSWREIHQKMNMRVVPNRELLKEFLDNLIFYRLARSDSESARHLRAKAYDALPGILVFLGNTHESVIIGEATPQNYELYFKTSVRSDKVVNATPADLYELLDSCLESILSGEKGRNIENKPVGAKNKATPVMANVEHEPGIMYTALEDRLMSINPDSSKGIVFLNALVQTIFSDPEASFDWYSDFARYYIHRSSYDRNLVDVDIFSLGLPRIETLSKLSSFEEVVNSIILDDYIYSYAPDSIDDVSLSHYDPERYWTRRNPYAYSQFVDLGEKKTRGEKEGAILSFVSDFNRSELTISSIIFFPYSITVYKTETNTASDSHCHVLFYRGKGTTVEDAFVPAAKLYEHIIGIISSLNIADANFGMNITEEINKALSLKIDLSGKTSFEKFSMVRSELKNNENTNKRLCFINGNTSILVSPLEGNYMIDLKTDNGTDVDMVRKEDLLEYIVNHI